MNEELEEDGLFEHHRIVCDPGQEPYRIDKFLMDRLPNVTRNRVQHGIKEGFVKVNGTEVKPSYKVHPEDEIVIALLEPPRDNELVAEDIPINIVYEDDDFLIVNKEPGMVVHPAYNNWTGTLVNALAYHFQQLPTMEGNDGRPGLVHRIDKGTSGLLVVAKTEMAMTNLAKQFFDHSIERTYYALIWGIPKESEGTIDVNLGRSEKDRRVTVAIEDGSRGRTAVTHYKVLKELRYISLIQCNLETGRTHQIRAHFKHLGHPLFNDATYGGDSVVKGTRFSKYKSFVDNAFKMIPRQALHAKSLGFIHPRTKKFVHFESELPQDFQNALTKWEDYVKYD